MDDLKMVEILGKASLFDLYRFKVILTKMLEDPKRLEEVRMKLQLNQKVSYFDTTTNKEISAEIVKIGRSNALVKNHHDGKVWQLPFYMINDGGIIENILSPTSKVDKLTLKVGELVGFITKEGKLICGTVSKLNQKTATIVIQAGGRWRVAYSYLFYVIEGEGGEGCLISSG